MLEIIAPRKNKICLLDYNYKKDIENRCLLSSLSELELTTLEEILFSSIKTSISRLSKDLDIQEKTLLPILKKLTSSELIQIDGEIVTIDKKMRKYFEFEYKRFEENFKPDLLFINNLLQKIPIHILPIWYSLPKSSNNIFESIIDKYFKTPHLFERHISNIEHEKEIFLHIIEDVYNAKDFEIEAKVLQKKYDLDKEKYLECILLLEFNFLCFQSYKKTKKGFVEVLSPFHEYKAYLLYLQKTKTASIENTKSIIRKRNTDFGFVKDLSSALKIAKNPISIEQLNDNLKKEISLKDTDIIITSTYINSVLEKLIDLKFLTKKEDLVKSASKTDEWLGLDYEKKALHLYYHPLNTLKNKNILPILIAEKAIKEAEKSILRVLNNDWVYFDDFKNGILSAIADEKVIKIISHGKAHKYFIPTYTSEEILFVKTIIFERLFETGIIAVGSLNGRDCFRVTKFGKSLFEIS